ncbi:thiol reductant ABC exporter subunit CydD [Neptuniibacter caesariensis]|uniref:Putative ABC cytochrome efflux transporter, fused ATP-binding and permease domains n=1 Tax=Neptuniibacter caesariensis TaxID=207954 RepID=A0A7U8C827_NEPCE|nr:thiol reductant ABC exporter subunit CydD [Neptuniibacter caesariensis]EAR62356.1 putative ABC cytochrome efflux transporter, fused ATP-binding and permease domains [Oceanospirillum sp. MED92] [Neptuniibacter caesariensis]
MKTNPRPENFKSKADLLKWFGKVASRHNQLLTLLGFFQVAVTISFAWLVATLLDAAIFAEQTSLPSMADWLVLTALLVIRPILSYLQSWAGNQASIKVRAEIRRFTLKQCFSLNIRLFPSFNVAELSNLLTTEINSLREYYSEFIAQKRLAVIMPIAIIIAASTVNWLVPLILALTAPLIPLFMILVGRKAAAASQGNLQQLNRLGNLLADRLKNLQPIQQAGTVEQEASQLYQQSDQFRCSTIRVLRLAFLSGTLLEFFSAISVALVAVYLGLFFLDKYQLGSWSTDLSLAEGVFLLMLAPEFYLPLRRMGALYHAKMDAESVAEHLMQLNNLVAENRHSNHKETVEKLQKIELIDAQSGDKGHLIHRPISFSLRPGEKLLLNGPSGSGKTTLLDTLAGLHSLPKGEIVINNQTQRLHQQAAWWSQIGYMPQKPELFFSTIRDNLCLGRTFSDAELYSALTDARADKMVRDLPGELDYQISDSGGYLSGGQAQRIALARVFLHQPRLLLLDEPTANLDADTAQAFLQQLQLFCNRGGMVIMASHRPADKRFFTKEVAMQAMRNRHD